MIKKITVILLFIASLSSFVSAEEVTRNDKLLISLIYPRAGGQAMKAPRAIPKPVKVSGQIFMDISPSPLNIKKDRYLVEYFLDDKLIYNTTGFDNAVDSDIGFGYLLDTTKYENGKHKLMVNYWDRDGSSAIGSKDVFIDNAPGE